MGNKHEEVLKNSSPSKCRSKPPTPLHAQEELPSTQPMGSAVEKVAGMLGTWQAQQWGPRLTFIQSIHFIYAKCTICYHFHH